MSDAEVTRDLSRVVGGLHGGMYQFGVGGAQYYAGSVFAASLAASVSEAAAAPGGELEGAEWPRWASELRAQPDALAGTLPFAGAAGIDAASRGPLVLLANSSGGVAGTVPSTWTVEENV